MCGHNFQRGAGRRCNVGRSAFCVGGVLLGLLAFNPGRRQAEAQSEPESLPASEISQSSELTFLASEPDQANTQAAQELSIEPGAQPLLPENAPAWIGALPETTGEVHRVHVGGQIADSPEEAAQLLDEALVSALSRYVDQSVLQPRGAATGLHKRLTPDYIWKNLIDDSAGYMARLNTSGVPLFQKWVTLSITPEQRDIIAGWNREAMQQQRLAPVGLGMLGLLGSVGLLHLIFKGRQLKS
jgi:hypothetical protein